MTDRDVIALALEYLGETEEPLAAHVYQDRVAVVTAEGKKFTVHLADLQSAGDVPVSEAAPPRDLPVDHQTGRSGDVSEAAEDEASAATAAGAQIPLSQAMAAGTEALQDDLETQAIELGIRRRLSEAELPERAFRALEEHFGSLAALAGLDPDQADFTVVDGIGPAYARRITGALRAALERKEDRPDTT